MVAALVLPQVVMVAAAVGVLAPQGREEYLGRVLVSPILDGMALVAIWLLGETVVVAAVLMAALAWPLVMAAMGVLLVMVLAVAEVDLVALAELGIPTNQHQPDFLAALVGRL